MWGFLAKLVSGTAKDVTGVAKDIVGVAKDATGIQKDRLDIEISKRQLEREKSSIQLASIDDVKEFDPKYGHIRAILAECVQNHKLMAFFLIFGIAGAGIAVYQYDAKQGVETHSFPNPKMNPYAHEEPYTVVYKQEGMTGVSTSPTIIFMLEDKFGRRIQAVCIPPEQIASVDPQAICDLAPTRTYSCSLYSSVRHHRLPPDSQVLSLTDAVCDDLKGHRVYLNFEPQP